MMMPKDNAVSNALRENNKLMFDSLEPSAKEFHERQEKLDRAQISTAAELQKLREEYEQYKIEQAKNDRLNRIYDLAMMLIAIGSMIIALVK